MKKPPLQVDLDVILLRNAYVMRNGVYKVWNADIDKIRNVFYGDYPVANISCHWASICVLANDSQFIQECSVSVLGYR